jgi:hypothetical protein
MAKISEGVGVCHQHRNTLIKGGLTMADGITIIVAITVSFGVESGKVSSSAWGQFWVGLTSQTLSLTHCIVG